MAVIGLGVMISGAVDPEASLFSIASSASLGVGLACIPYIVARAFDAVFSRHTELSVAKPASLGPRVGPPQQRANPSYSPSRPIRQARQEGHVVRVPTQADPGLIVGDNKMGYRFELSDWKEDVSGLAREVQVDFEPSSGQATEVYFRSTQT